MTTGRHRVADREEYAMSRCGTPADAAEHLHSLQHVLELAAQTSMTLHAFLSGLDDESLAAIAAAATTVQREVQEAQLHRRFTALWLACAEPAAQWPDEQEPTTTDEQEARARLGLPRRTEPTATGDQEPDASPEVHPGPDVDVPVAPDPEPAPSADASPNGPARADVEATLVVDQVSDGAA